MTKELHALFVDDYVPLRRAFLDNLEIAFEQVGSIQLTHKVADSVEEGRRLLPEGQQTFRLVIVDLLWPPVGGGESKVARGLDVIRQAAKTPGVVIVAFSAGNPDKHPDLPVQAREAGAHIFRYRGTLIASARAGTWDSLASEIIHELDPTLEMSRMPGPQSPPRDAHDVFVVVGRDEKVNDSMFAFLGALGLRPMEWETLLTRTSRETGAGGNPNILDTIKYGFSIAHGAVVLFTPDDEACLSAPHRRGHDPAFESRLTGQPRPNVLFEAGYAVSHAPDRTLIVTVGSIRPISDLGGMHMMRLDNSFGQRSKMAERLRAMGFAVETTGDLWRSIGSFG